MTDHPTDPVEVIRRHFYLENGLPYGECMADFQLEFFEAIFAARSDGTPKYRLLYSERRRGEAKTFDLSAAALADLLTGPPRHHSFAVAAAKDQAGLLKESIADFRARSEALAEIEVQGELIKNPVTGSDLRILSSEDRVQYGLRPRRVWFDELSLQTDSRLWTVMWSAIGKSRMSQMVCASMSGWDFGSIAWKIREQARTNSAYFFATRQGTELAPWLTAENMEEQRATLHPADFARFWECTWREPHGSWLTAEMYQDAERGVEAYSRDASTRQYGFVDIGLTHDPTTLAIVHEEAGEVVVLDSLSTLQGSKAEPVQLKAVEQLITDLTRRFNVVKWRIEAPQGAATAQELADRLPATVELQHPTAKSQGDLWGNLWRLFRAHRIVLFPHDRLKQEALSLVTKTVGGVIKTVESSSIHQDHILAVGGAAQLLEAEKATAIFGMAVAYGSGVYAGFGPGGEYGRSELVTRDSDGDEAWPASLNNGPVIIQ